MLDLLTGNAIIFNGEIYNFQALRKNCESAGDVFNPVRYRGYSSPLPLTWQDSSLMAPLFSAVIRRTFRAFNSGRDGHESPLWTLLMFGWWRMQIADISARIEDGSFEYDPGSYTGEWISAILQQLDRRRGSGGP